jgi:hypothetical protein
MTTRCRGGSQLSATRKAIVPDPVPDLPRVTLIHDASGAAVQGHPAWVVSVAVISKDTDMHGVNSIGVTEYSQPDTSPDCTTSNVRPPTAIPPVRAAMSRFLSTANVTVPFPVPSAPEISLTQAAPLVPTQAQSPGAMTAKLPVSLPSSKEALAGEMSTVHSVKPSSRTGMA